MNNSFKKIQLLKFLTPKCWNQGDIWEPPGRSVNLLHFTRPQSHSAKKPESAANELTLIFFTFPYRLFFIRTPSFSRRCTRGEGRGARGQGRRCRPFIERDPQFESRCEIRSSRPGVARMNERGAVASRFCDSKFKKKKIETYCFT